MILIVGLGNPGRKYKKTRHNVGWRVIDALKSLDFAQDKNIILLKPQTYMNKSGKEVKSIVTKYKIPTINIWVIHDDSDLPLGTIKISQDAGSAGHKGIQSIIDELKTRDFARIRIGIRPTIWPGPRKKAEEFVLKKFAKEEKEMAKKVIEKTIEIIKEGLKTGIKKTTIVVN